MFNCWPVFLGKTGTEVCPRDPGPGELTLISGLGVPSLHRPLTMRKTVTPTKHLEPNASFSLLLCPRTCFSALFWWLKHFLEKPAFEVIRRLQKSIVLFIRKPTFSDRVKERNHIGTYAMHFYWEALVLGVMQLRMCASLHYITQAALLCKDHCCIPGSKEPKKVLAGLLAPMNIRAFSTLE